MSVLIIACTHMLTHILYYSKYVLTYVCGICSDAIPAGGYCELQEPLLMLESERSTSLTK